MIYPIFRDILYAHDSCGIQILSRNLAENTKPKMPYAVISITDPGDTLCKLPKSKDRKDVLRLCFHDVDFDQSSCKSINADDATQIVNFVLKNLDKVDLFVIHCTMGMSRSSAVGAAISKYINGDDALFFKYYTPNSTVFRTVLSEFYNHD